MSQIETKVGSSEAGPAQISQIASFLSSDTVKGPRELPTELLSRLDQVAVTNRGRVPLHGRLFAQWMHNAFPRECPYPHTAGSISPQTPDEWMQQTGHEATAATREDMDAVVAAEASCVGPDCAGKGTSLSLDDALPWNDVEELLDARVPFARRKHRDGDADDGASLNVFIGLVASILSIFLAVDAWTSRKTGMERLKYEAFAEFDAKHGARQADWQLPMTLGALAFTGYVLGLVNKTIVMVGVCCSLAVLSSQRVAVRMKKA